LFKRKISWIGLALAAVFLALFLYRVDFGQMVQVLRKANYYYIAPAILVYFIGVWFRAVRWRLLLRSLGDFPSRRLVSPILIGFAINNILPARVGLIVRAYLLGIQQGVSKIASGATVVVDQLFDGLALLFFLGIIAIIIPLPAWAKATALVSAIIFIGFFMLLLVLALSPHLTRWLVERLTHWLPSRWQPGIADSVNKVLAGLAPLQRPDRIAIAFFLSLLVWAIEAGVFYLVAFSFGLGQPFPVMLLVTSISNIAITLPSLPGGIGPFEFFGKQTLTLFAVPEATATAYIAVLHIVLLLPVTLAGLGLLALKRVSIAEATGRNREEK